MPNQLNYSQPITTEFQRPHRISKIDEDLLNITKQQILFGTNANDIVELWMYNQDGTFASHFNLGFNDTALTIATVITPAGPTEILNIDLKDVGNRMQIQPGRYVMVGNFFRDEVGSEVGYKLYISDISNDRTQVVLTPVAYTDQVSHDIFSFITPSVPKLYAKGLVDQIFGTAIQFDTTQQITPETLLPVLDNIIPNTTNRITNSDTLDIYNTLVTTLLSRVYSTTLNNMATDVFNLEIQYIELEKYLENAIDSVIYNMMQTGEISPQFELR